TLAGLFGVVVEFQGIHAHARNAALMRGVHVEAALGDGERGGAALADRLRPFLNRGIEFVVRHADIGQTHGHGLFSRIALVQVPDFACLLFAHHTGQEGRAVARVDRTHLGTDLPEDGLVGADREITDRAQHVAAADGIALHASNDGLGHVADGGVQFFHGQADGAAAIVVAVVRRLIAAGAKGTVAGTGQHDATHVAVVAGLVQGIDQLVAGLPAKGVHLLGPVDGDPGHAVADFVENVFVVHVQFLFADAYASAVHGE